MKNLVFVILFLFSQLVNASRIGAGGGGDRPTPDSSLKPAMVYFLNDFPEGVNAAIGVYDSNGKWFSQNVVIDRQELPSNPALYKALMTSKFAKAWISVY